MSFNDKPERVVHTKRFHYGGSVGVTYKLNESISLESSITYTFGREGAALPLQNITREIGSNEVKYDNYQTVKTDILLINAGIRFNLFKNYSYNPPSKPSNNNSTNSYNSSDSKRYYDDSSRSNSNSGSISSPRSNTPSKKPLPVKVKSD